MINVLDEDPELGEPLPADQLRLARTRARAETIERDRGTWRVQRWPARVRCGIGLLVLDGLLVRRVGFDGRFGCELLAHGDLLRPWQREDAVASVPHSSGWRVLRHSRLAVLDVDFARRIAAFPEIYGELQARAIRRSRQLGVNMAIIQHRRVEERLHLMLWHLADRWGTVRPEGVHLPVRLTHTVLADLLAARRPTVTTAMRALERDGKVARANGSVVLRRAPPGELGRLEGPAPWPLKR